jgi:hypothetical protein
VQGRGLLAAVRQPPEKFAFQAAARQFFVFGVEHLEARLVDGQPLLAGNLNRQG